ncbi:hypothetical protein B0H14DRAFT_207086 [Mycena olivaceomarginata]|nr:hypothetical protein B0H14DRAFT_207086 [Mycena olivaceomarginata]
MTLAAYKTSSPVSYPFHTPLRLHHPARPRFRRTTIHTRAEPACAPAPSCTTPWSPRWRSPHPSQRNSTDTQCLAVFALGMDGALADVLVCALASHHIHLCLDELEAPPSPLLLVHPQKTVKGVIPFPLTLTSTSCVTSTSSCRRSASIPRPLFRSVEGNDEAGGQGEGEQVRGRRVRGSRTNMPEIRAGMGWRTSCRYPSCGAASREGERGSVMPRLTWTSGCHLGMWVGIWEATPTLHSYALLRQGTTPGTWTRRWA